MQEIIFKYLDRHYEKVKDWRTETDYNINNKGGSIMYYSNLVEELSLIFGADIYIVCEYVYEWVKDYDLDLYYNTPPPPQGGGYSVVFGGNNVVSGNYSIGF